MKKTTNKTLLVLAGLLLIIVSISSGCIGGKGDSGGTDSGVTGGSGTGRRCRGSANRDADIIQCLKKKLKPLINRFC